jgi:chemotaxis protein CheD
MMPDAHRSDTAGAKRIHVVQGEYAVSDDPDVMLGTILGSCVAACVRDPVAGVGGMNHFLLPGDKEGAATGGGGPQALRYGVQSMELLLNALYRMGARRERLEVKLFGGARVIDGLSDVGQQNAAFAERFLKAEGITLMGGSLRGEQARRVQFWPVSGRVRQMALVDPGRQVFEAERAKPIPAPAADDGELELF